MLSTSEGLTATILSELCWSQKRSWLGGQSSQNSTATYLRQNLKTITLFT